MWFGVFPVALTPVWQLPQFPLTPAWLKFAGSQAFVL
jgi:hypothetical protein